MSRFQAQTNTVLERQLDDLRERLGLRENQRADLLRELASIASWVIQHAESGRRIEARRGKDVIPLRHPVVERVRDARGREQARHGVYLSDAEVERLAAILARGFSPTPGLRKAFANLSGMRTAPRITRKDPAA